MEENLPRETLAEMYRRMRRIRLFEDTVEVMHRNGEIPGSCHTSQGQEGEIVGACMALRPDDTMIGNHRSHGHPIGKGAALRGLMAEILGRATGVCGGKGGSMHLSDFSVGSLGETSIVGSGIPVAAGAALGAKMQGLDRVSLCFFGDGASNEGTFHEGINMAARWALPVVFLCENNAYGASTAFAETTLVTDVAARAAAYGIPGTIVDGQDLLAVHAAVTQAVRRARAGEGPSLVEAKTYRYSEHAVNMGRELGYRTPDEVAAWRDRDPLTLFQRRLVGEFGFDAQEVAAIDAAAEAELADAIAFAKASPFPERSAAFSDVYA